MRVLAAIRTRFGIALVSVAEATAFLLVAAADYAVSLGLERVCPQGVPLHYHVVRAVFFGSLGLSFLILILGDLFSLGAATCRKVASVWRGEEMGSGDKDA